MSHLTFLEAGVVGLFQGVTELFPVSSLGHNVLIPALIGGSWARDLNVASPENPYLAFIVGMHVATAIALLAYFWRDWVRIIRGFVSSLVTGRMETVDQKLAWMILLATIPVGLVGMLFADQFQTLFGVPIRAALLLFANGLILLAGERFRTRASRRADAEIAAADDTGGGPDASTPAVVPAGSAAAASNDSPRTAGLGAAGSHQATRASETSRAIESDRRLAAMGYGRAVAIGSAQILALMAGISRDGAAMVAGMFGGLSREDAARFAFLLATPVILAAGLLKLPDLFGPMGAGIGGQVLFGSVLAGVGAFLAVRFLVRYFQSRTLTPFAIYCMVAGLGSAIYLTAR